MLAPSDTVDAVERDRRRLPGRRDHARALGLGRAARLERAQRRRVGAHDDLAEAARRRTACPRRDRLDEAVDAEHERDAERARDDGGVRGRTAALGGEAGDAEPVQLQRIHRRQVEADDDGAGERLVVVDRRQAEEPPQEALGDLLDVGEALAEASVVHLREGEAELIDDHADRPFGADAALADESPRAVDELVALQDGAVRLDDLCAHCRRRRDLTRRPRPWPRRRRRRRRRGGSSSAGSAIRRDLPLLDEEASHGQADRSHRDAAACSRFRPDEACCTSPVPGGKNLQVARLNAAFAAKKTARSARNRSGPWLRRGC